MRRKSSLLPRTCLANYQQDDLGLSKKALLPLKATGTANLHNL